MQQKINIQNKKARFEFELLEKFDAGIQLYGTEIKSIRESKASITESFCQFKDGELFVVNMNIDPYAFGNYYNHKQKRERKLLLNKTELKKLEKKVNEKGLAIVPLNLYLNSRGLAKLKIALGKGKKLHDKRHSLKQKDLERDLRRINK